MYIHYLIIVLLLYKECQALCSGTTCGECISSDYSCSWCRQGNFSAPRCQPKNDLNKTGCEDRNIENPQSSMKFEQDLKVRDSNEENERAIQIQPQKVRITTRPLKEYKVPMTFRAANNFPVDLYFLFDNSFTMESQIQNLANLANDIGLSINDISRNFLMGYGVFQDKVILPFTETVQEKLVNPCTGINNKICDPPFEFKHLLNFTRNIGEFKDRVKNTSVSGNIDHPEGSLDAILQAITCKTEIGWRSIGRKLLIFASNDRFHLAGDGRLAGIVIPNDGQCHLDATGKYAKELEQDYPSVSQLADIVRKNEVHIIFAVTSEQMDLFEMLKIRIPQSTVQLLANPDDKRNQNIKEIIEAKYKEMVSEVEIVYEKVKGVDVNIKATSDICERKGTNICKGQSLIEKLIKFDVEVTVTECPSTPAERVKKVIIYPNTMRNDSMVIEIETLCECDCRDDSATWEVNSPSCTEGNGTLKCGLCECNKDRFGQFCECGATDFGSATSQCIRPGMNSTVPCSGSGTCECGICKCDPKYSGPHCECNDCENVNGKICGGEARGHCDCGRCVCKSEYTGDTCDCPKSNKDCMFDEKVCNNAGTCKCGECNCTIKGYEGKKCETCAVCGTSTSICDVQSYRKCAECAVSTQNKDCPHCPEIKHVTSVEETSIGKSILCEIKQEDGCTLFFRITAVSGHVTIFVQNNTACPESVNIVPIAVGVVGGVVAIGLLLLLLWKILTTVFDRIEYSKFEEDLKHCKWAQQDNPFYKGATTTYKNPMLDTSEPMRDN